MSGWSVALLAWLLGSVPLALLLGACIHRANRRKRANEAWRKFTALRHPIEWSDT
jgi:hypothetical protein